MEKKYIGGLYHAVGLETPTEIIDKRLGAAQKIFENLSFSQAQSLVLVLFVGAVDAAAVQWLVDSCQDDIPGFGAAGIDRDIEIMAAVLLKEVIENPKKFSARICLLIETASFGGKRKCKIDPEIPTYARAKLFEFQAGAVDLATLGPNEFFDYDELFTAAATGAAANNFGVAWPPVKEVLEDVIATSEQIAEAHLGKINELVGYVKHLEEQNQTQWFAISKWSKTANAEFASLAVGEALARAAFELSKIVQSSVGPAAAPALLHMALSNVTDISDTKEISFADTCTASPIIWRKSWLQVDARTLTARLTPILAALAMAAEANDEPDWQARFKREVEVDPNFQLRPLDFSIQLFHELLVMRTKA